MFMVTAVGAAVSLVGFWPGSARWPGAHRAAAAGASRDGESITAQAPPLDRGQNSRFKVQRSGGGWFRHRFGRATASGAPDGSGGASTGGAAGGPGAFSGPVRLRRLLREPYLRNLAAFQGLYVGVEAALAGWLATYLVEQFGATPAAAALATSLYWGGFLVGRPATAVIAHRYGPQRVLPWLCPLGAAAAAAGVVAPSAAWATAAYAAAGL